MKNFVTAILMTATLTLSSCGGGQAGPDFRYVEEMYADSYFPNNLVEKVEAQIVKVETFIREGGHAVKEIQEKLDSMTEQINRLNDEFWANDSEIETVARESIARTVEEILAHYKINIDTEEALRLREW